MMVYDGIRYEVKNERGEKSRRGIEYGAEPTFSPPPKAVIAPLPPGGGGGPEGLDLSPPPLAVISNPSITFAFAAAPALPVPAATAPGPRAGAGPGPGRGRGAPPPSPPPPPRASSRSRSCRRPSTQEITWVAAVSAARIICAASSSAWRRSASPPASLRNGAMLLTTCRAICCANGWTDPDMDTDCSCGGVCVKMERRSKGMAVEAEANRAGAGNASGRWVPEPRPLVPGSKASGPWGRGLRTFCGLVCCGAAVERSPGRTRCSCAGGCSGEGMAGLPLQGAGACGGGGPPGPPWLRDPLRRCSCFERRSKYFWACERTWTEVLVRMESAILVHARPCCSSPWRNCSCSSGVQRICSRRVMKVRRRLEGGTVSNGGG